MYASGDAFHGNISAVRLDHGFHDGKPKAKSILFCCDERIENLRKTLDVYLHRVDRLPVIPYGDDKALLALNLSRSDPDVAGAGIGGV